MLQLCFSCDKNEINLHVNLLNIFNFMSQLLPSLVIKKSYFGQFIESLDQINKLYDYLD